MRFRDDIPRSRHKLVSGAAEAELRQHRGLEPQAPGLPDLPADGRGNTPAQREVRDCDAAIVSGLHLRDLRCGDRLGLSLDEAEHLTGWLDRVRKRPATQKAIGFFGPNAMF